MTIQTLSKTVHLSENWEENDYALFKQYMSDVYNTNQSVNNIFDNPKLKVISMDLEIKVNVREVESITGGNVSSSFAESIATSLINEAIDSPVESTDFLDSFAE